MLLVAFSKYTGRAVFDDGSLELLPLREEKRLGRREKEAMESGRRERIEEGGGGRSKKKKKKDPFQWKGGS